LQLCLCLREKLFRHGIFVWTDAPVTYFAIIKRYFNWLSVNFIDICFNWSFYFKNEQVCKEYFWIYPEFVFCLIPWAVAIPLMMVQLILFNKTVIADIGKWIVFFGNFITDSLCLFLSLLFEWQDDRQRLRFTEVSNHYIAVHHVNWIN